MTTLDLLDGAKKKLSPGGYEGTMVILFYDQESGERAIVDTDIPVNINVQE